MTNECGRRTASSGDNTPRSTCWPSASYSRLRVVIRVEAFAPPRKPIQLEIGRGYSRPHIVDDP